MVRLLLMLPVLIVLIAFALSNQQPVRLGLWPTDVQVDLPISIAVLIAAGVFFVVGAFVTWGASVAARSRARRAERQVRALENEVATLRARPVPAVGGAMALPPPGE